MGNLLDFVQILRQILHITHDSCVKYIAVMNLGLIIDLILKHFQPENVKVFPPSHLLGLLLPQLVGNVLQPLHLIQKFVSNSIHFYPNNLSH